MLWGRPARRAPLMLTCVVQERWVSALRAATLCAPPVVLSCGPPAITGRRMVLVAEAKAPAAASLSAAASAIMAAKRLAGTVRAARPGAAAPPPPPPPPRAPSPPTVDDRGGAKITRGFLFKKGALPAGACLVRP